jgi:hypothetical protein
MILAYGGRVPLCSDVCRVIQGWVDERRCKRCQALLDTAGQVRMCFVRSECFCFACYHRVRFNAPP